MTPTEADREYHRRWRAENPDKVARIHQRYRDAHRDDINERHGRWEKDNADTKRAYGLKYRHGMTLADWDAMWDAQGGRCYLCQEPLAGRSRGTHIDHDQSCCPPQRSCASCRRGLAHSGCNRMVGRAKDDPEWFRRFADNLEMANRRLRDPARLGMTAELAEEV
jgi:hypothetical protein